MSLTLLTSKSCPSTQFTSTALGPFLCPLILICNKKHSLKQIAVMYIGFSKKKANLGQNMNFTLLKQKTRDINGSFYYLTTVTFC